MIEQGEGTTYEQAGVNIEAGDDLSRTLYEAAMLTWGNREGEFGQLEELFSSFSGFRAMPAELLGKTEDIYLGMSDDGVGTKVEVAERIHDHSTVAFDLFAMVCDDAVVRGAEPIAVTTTLDVRRLDESEETKLAIEQLAQGYVRAARDAGVVVINGEVAELGDRVGGYGEFNYNWSATVLWAAHKERLLDGRAVRAGDYILALPEQGFRSNGLSLVRKIMQENYGQYWHNGSIKLPSGYQKLGELVRQPSKIYARFINELTGGYRIERQPRAEVHGIAHITGGGVPGKLGRLLEVTGSGADIFSPYEPPEIMRLVQSLGQVSAEEAYRTWNMGHGMLIVTPEPDEVAEAALAYGLSARYVGQVSPKSGIRIRNKGGVGSLYDTLHFD